MSKIEAVSCMYCGRLHNIKHDRFISIHGNICIGMGDGGIGGGVIGNNLNSEGFVKHVSIICRDIKDCFGKFSKSVMPGIYRKENTWHEET